MQPYCPKSGSDITPEKWDKIKCQQLINVSNLKITLQCGLVNNKDVFACSIFMAVNVPLIRQSIILIFDSN